MTTEIKMASKPVQSGLMMRVLSRMASSESLISDSHQNMLIGLLSDADKVEDPMAATAAMRTEFCASWDVPETEESIRKPFVYRDGVALIPVHGILINRFNYCWGFVTGYEFIRKQMNLAEADPDVRLIVFDHDTPGGDAAGCSELAVEIKALTKPTLAIVNTLSASGGYWLAAPCDRVVCSPSGSVGSIGVYIQHMNIGKMLAEWGIENEYVKAGDYKVSGNPFEGLSKKDRQYLQQMVDERYDEFVAAVAEFRGIEETVARDTEARVMRPTEALALGLIDAAVSPAAAVADFVAELGRDDPEYEETQEETMAEITSEDRVAVAKETQARIRGIMTHEEAKGREGLAEHLAYDTDNTVEQAAAILKASPKAEAAKEEPAKEEPAKEEPAKEEPAKGDDDDGESGEDGEQAKGKKKSEFAKAMDDGDHPELGADGKDKAKGASAVDRIMSAHAAATGRPEKAKA